MAKIPKSKRKSNQRTDFITHLLIRMNKTILSHFRHMEKHFVHLRSTRMSSRGVPNGREGWVGEALASLSKGRLKSPPPNNAGGLHNPRRRHPRKVGDHGKF